MDRAKQGHILSAVFALGINSDRAARKLTDSLRRIEQKAMTYVSTASRMTPQATVEKELMAIFRPVEKLLHLPNWPVSVKLDVTAHGSMVVIPAHEVEYYGIPILKNAAGDGMVAGGLS
jgi:hypothetical protein